jgi:hypothetical protein
MEPFEIQPDAFVEKQKEVIAQLTNENILLTCRVEQLEQELSKEEAAQPATTDSFGAPVADEVEAAERAKDDFPEMNDPPDSLRTFLESHEHTSWEDARAKSWDVT